MRLLRWLAVASTLASPFVAVSVAHAETRPVSGSASAPVGPTLGVSTQLAFVHGEENGFQPYVAIAVTPSYRISRHFELALNLTAAHGPTDTEIDWSSLGHEAVTIHRDLLTADVEARYRGAVGRDVEVWIGGELGAADAIRDADHYGAPLVGAGAGIDLRLGQYWSLGFEAHGRVMAFGPLPSDGLPPPNGVTPAFYSGLVVSLLLPRS
jgi:hypothetical protein